MKVPGKLDVLHSLSRRSFTVEDLQTATGRTENSIRRALRGLAKSGDAASVKDFTPEAPRRLRWNITPRGQATIKSLRARYPTLFRWGD